MAKPSNIGAPVWRVEGGERVSGQAAYGADVHFAGTLWGKILRSPHPRIVRIDTSKASQVRGVKAIVTGKDEPNHYWGKSIRDIPALVEIPATAERVYRELRRQQAVGNRQ